MKNNPIVITNPSNGAIIKVHPGQDIIIRVDQEDWVGIADIDFDSPYLEMSPDLAENGDVFFYQTEDLSEWAEYSQVHLGDIYLFGSETISISVVLESKNNHNTLTVINPQYCDLIIRPLQQLEIVFNNINDDPIHPKIISGDSGISYILKHSCILESTDFTYYSGDFVTCRRSSSNDDGQEYHLFFEPYLPKNQIFSTGYYDGGSIIFGESIKVSLDVRVRKKDIKRLWKNTFTYKPHSVNTYYKKMKNISMVKKESVFSFNTRSGWPPAKPKNDKKPPIRIA
jgi:hypothetical protein